jgi:predicted metalloendopeptidase
MVGDFYGSCMDESAIEKKGDGSADAGTGADGRHQDESGFDSCRIAAMHRNSTSALFAFYSQPDMHDSETIATSTRAGSRCRIATTT